MEQVTGTILGGRRTRDLGWSCCCCCCCCPTGLIPLLGRRFCGALLKTKHDVVHKMSSVTCWKQSSLFTTVCI